MTACSGFLVFHAQTTVGFCLGFRKIQIIRTAGSDCVQTSKELLVFFLGCYFDFSKKKKKLRRTVVEDFILFYFIFGVKKLTQMRKIKIKIEYYFTCFLIYYGGKKCQISPINKIAQKFHHISTWILD